MDEFSSEMYKEHILDLYKNPEHFGHIEKRTHHFNGHNPLCGDQIEVEMLVSDGKVSDAKFTGKGCAISMASASMLMDKIIGMNIEDVMKLKKEDVLNLLKIPIGPVRLKCALISLETVHKAVNNA